MFHIGFSYVGLIYLIMLFVPNIIWAKNKPEGYERYAEKEKKSLLAFERVGEALVCVCVLIFSDFNIRNTYWIGWLIASFAFMVLYEIYWFRYFRSQKTMKDFYSGFLGIPVAGATLPVIAFFLLGVYGSNAFLLISVVVLGIGHIGIHICHRNEVYGKKKEKLPNRILKSVLAFIGIFMAVFILFITASRNRNYVSHYKMIDNGVDEGTFLTL